MILAMNEVAVETTHRGSLFTVEVRHAQDEHGRSFTREIVRHPGAVLVLPVLDDGNNRRVVMIRNYRVAVDQRLWELPAGKLEPGEEPVAAAGRELIEETGYRAGRLTKLGEFYTSPGFADELIRVYLAESLNETEQALEAGEDIEVCVVDPDDAIAMTLDGRIRDGKTIAALLMWHLADSRQPQAESATP